MFDRYTFRARDVNTGEWRKGFLSYLGKHAHISIMDRIYICYASTVGQCTGVKDEDGTLIFEGDRIFDGTVGLPPWRIVWDDDVSGFVLMNGTSGDGISLHPEYAKTTKVLQNAD